MRLTIPNQLTILRIVLTPFFLVYFSQSDPQSRLIGAILFFIASITDWYDGYIARKLGVITRFGQFMDPLADKILVLSAFFLFSYMGVLNVWMVLIIIIRDTLITAIRIFAIHRGMPIVTHIIAKWKTFLQMAFIALLIIWFTAEPWLTLSREMIDLSHQVANGVLLIITLITVYSLIVYIKENFNLVSQFFKQLLLWWR
ncbi:MAG: CDP-diacylglycerol--glycerol-3-phosphate 3-phosphatidyltransferase [Calditrichia bacterium]